MTTEAIVVPLKRFDLAKDRLRQGADLDVTALAEELAAMSFARVGPVTSSCSANTPRSHALPVRSARKSGARGPPVSTRQSKALIGVWGNALSV